MLIETVPGRAVAPGLPGLPPLHFLGRDGRDPNQNVSIDMAGRVLGTGGLGHPEGQVDILTKANRRG